VRKNSFSRIKLEKRKENVVYVNSGCVIPAMSIYKSNLTIEETFPNKGILKQLIKEGKNLTFYTIVNKAKTLNMP
jgi:hypothetical protein